MGYGTWPWVLVLLAFVASSGAGRAQTVTDPTLTVTTVIPSSAGLNQPTTLAFVAPNEFLLLEKVGRVRSVVNGVLQPNPALVLNVNSLSERGLLGIAVNKSLPPSVFLYVTEAVSPEGTPIANRVYRYTWDANTHTLVNQSLVLELPVLSGPNHNGGILVLGNPGQYPGVGDGAPLYVIIGDLNHASQLQNFTAGDPPDDTGVIFRVLQNGATPPDNPFRPYCSVTTTQTCAVDANCPGGETCRTKVARYFAYGVRNSFGLAIDPVTGGLWDTENGPASMDEVNRIAPGFNSGWVQVMGPDALDPEGTANMFHMPGAGITYSDPEFSWGQTVAPTAILFPVGSSLGATYDQAALVGDSNLGSIYSLPLNVARNGFLLPGGLADGVAEVFADADPVRLGSAFGAVTDLKLGPDGHVYVVDIFGRVLRIAGPRSNDVTALPGEVTAALVAALLLAVGLAAARRRKSV